MKVRDRLLVLAFGSVLAANLLAPKMLMATDCCKLCGNSGTLGDHAHLAGLFSSSLFPFNLYQ